MEKDYQRALELSFTHGYGSCVFKHDICGDQLEISDYMPNFPNFLSLECFASLRCPPLSRGTTAWKHHREGAEESGRSAPLGGFK